MSEICAELHLMLNRLKKFTYPFLDSDIPANGVFVIFEKGEIGHGVNRIVFVGTHNGEGLLLSRFKEHFVNENKDRSILRKNIGRALLLKNSDSFITKWDQKTLSQKDRQEKMKEADLIKLKQVEIAVSSYIRNNFWVSVMPVGKKENRLQMKLHIISTISLCAGCVPSENWLGLNSPKEKIRKSGLWLEQGLFKTPLTAKEINYMKEILL